jgi:hypothetical protein
MGLGETIGRCVLQSQNNNTNGLYAPWDQGSHQVHIALHGDPTLKMFPVVPAGSLTIATEPGRANLSWSGSTDAAIAGYHVYRSTSPDGPFARLTSEPVAALSYSDTPAAASYVYMVRAIKLEETGSGTFYNPSEGITQTATVAGELPHAPAAPVIDGSAVSYSEIHLTWLDTPNANGYHLERKTGSDGSWSEIASFPSGQGGYSDGNLTSSTDFYYRLRAFNDAGNSDYSNELKITTPPAPQTPLHLGIHISGAGLSITIEGEVGTPYVVEQSSDLRNWSESSSGTLSTTEQEVVIEPGSSRLFLRTRTGP